MSAKALLVGLMSAALLFSSVLPATAAEPCRREQRLVAKNERTFVKKQQKVVKKVAKKDQAIAKIDRKAAVTGAQQMELAIRCALGDERACRKLNKVIEKLERYAQLRTDTVARYDAAINDLELDAAQFHDYDLVPSQTALQQCLAG